MFVDATYYCRQIYFIFSGLLHINGNSNYSQIEIYHSHVKKMSQKYAPKIYENLHKNEGINETNLPFSA